MAIVLYCFMLVLFIICIVGTYAKFTGCTVTALAEQYLPEQNDVLWSEEQAKEQIPIVKAELVQHYRYCKANCVTPQMQYRRIDRHYTSTYKLLEQFRPNLVNAYFVCLAPGTNQTAITRKQFRSLEVCLECPKDAVASVAGNDLVEGRCYSFPANERRTYTNHSDAHIVLLRIIYVESGGIAKSAKDWLSSIKTWVGNGS